VKADRCRVSFNRHVCELVIKEGRNFIHNALKQNVMMCRSLSQTNVCLYLSMSVSMSIYILVVHKRKTSNALYAKQPLSVVNSSEMG